MKKLLLLIGIFSIMNFANAQGYYSLTKKGVETAFDWNYLVATGNTASLVQDRDFNDKLTSSQYLPSGFSFSFYGNAVTTYKVSDNGYITFDGTASSSDATPATLPSNTKPLSSIFAFWTDLELKQAAYNANLYTRIVSWTYGTSPNRVHCIQWYGASKKGSAIGKGSDALCFAIRLHETSNIFDIVHSWGTCSFTGGIGAQNSDGTSGLLLSNTAAHAYSNPTLGTNDDATVYEFRPGTQQAWDMTATGTQMGSVFGKNTNVDVKGTLANYGSNTVTSFTLNYSVNGGTAVSQNVTGVNIAASGGTYNFTHATPYVPSAAGTYTIKVWASNLNGNTDGDLSNDEASTSITVYDLVYPRVALHEVFTSSTCPPCNPGNAKLDPILDGQDAATWACVKYQMSWPGTGDPYYTLEGKTRQTYYAVSGIPDLAVDGKVVRLNPNGYTTAMFTSAQSIPALIDIKAKHWQVGQSVNVDVDITPQLSLSNVNLFISVNEKLTDQNVKTNGETEFHHVMKKMMGTSPTNGGAGFKISLTDGTPFKISKGITFAGSYYLPNDATDAEITKNNVLTKEHSVEGFDDLEVVVWVQNLTTKEVFQAANSVAYANGVKEIGKLVTDLNIYPSPANNLATIQFSLLKSNTLKTEILDVTGKVVKTLDYNNQSAGIHTINLNTAEFSNGVYMVRVLSGDEQYTQRFVVAH